MDVVLWLKGFCRRKIGDKQGSGKVLLLSTFCLVYPKKHSLLLERDIGNGKG